MNSNNSPEKQRNETDEERGGLMPSRRGVMKLTGGGLGATAVGGTLLGSATAATTSADGDCVQVDLVLGNTINDLGSNTYSSQGRLVAAQWGDYVNEGTGETTTKYPISDTCQVDVTSDISIDFSNGDPGNEATVTFDINNCSTGSQDVTLVSYETPCNSGAGQFDPANADSQTQFFWNTRNFSSNTSATMSVEVPDPNLQAYFPLDDAINGGSNAVDAANGNDATINGDVGTSASGQVNGAYDFDLSNDYLTYPDLGINYSGGSDWTTAMWINPDSLPTDAGDGDPDHLWHPRARRDFHVKIEGSANLASGSSEIAVSTYDGSLNVLSSGVTPPTGQWTHVAVVFDTSASNQYEVFVDGTSEATGNLPTGNDTSGSNLIGAQVFNGENRYHFDGQIDEFRVYDRALLDSEITDLANNGS